MIDSEEYATCPYNSSHRVPRARFQHHLIKCQKNNPPLVICPFNATHRFPEHMIKDHCKICPNKPEMPFHTKRDSEDTIGSITAPKPILQREYIAENDPENDCWDD